MENVTNVGPGRPRLTAQRRPGTSARAEILDAAAELFTTRGFTATSTRHIAEAVGMRQASLYNHFSTKDDILVSLLADTVTPALDFAETLTELDCSAPVKLYALARMDTAQLISERWNLGVLYLLPELHGDRYSTFRADRDRLQAQYRTLAAETLVLLGRTESANLVDLPFRLVESVISSRANESSGHITPDATSIADSTLRVLGWTQSLDSIVSEAASLMPHAEMPKMSGAR